MAKTSGELEQEFIQSLTAATGKDLTGWMKEISASGISKRNDILDWLKTQKGFGHMHASLLTGIYANGGKPVYASEEVLLDAQFEGKEHMRPLYQNLIATLLNAYPDATVLPKKTYVSITGKREFAAINIRPKELRFGLDLGERAFEGRVEKSKLSGPMPRISHMLTITGAQDFDTEMMQLVSESYHRVH